MARYKIVALPTMSKGGIFNRKKNQQPPQVTHTAIDPKYLEKHPDFASSIQNMPEVGTSYTRKRDKWGRPEGDPYYQYDKKKKGWIDDQGRSYQPQWKIDEDIKRKEENKSWGQRFEDFINQDVLGYPSDKEREILGEKQRRAALKSQMSPEEKEAWKKADPIGYAMKQDMLKNPGKYNNYNDGAISMVVPEAYVMGPGAGGAGMVKQGINALMEGVAGINKFAVNDLLSAGVRSTLSPLERTLAEKATVGNVLGAYGAADAVVNKAPKFAGDISSMATHGYSSDKALDALKQAADIGSSFLSYSPLAVAKNLNKAKDVYSLSKAAVSNLEDPTNLEDQYKFYKSLGKLSGIKKKGGSSKPCPEGKIYDPITRQCISEQAYQITDYIGTNKQNVDTKQAVSENQNYLTADKFLTDYYNSPMYKQMVYGSARTPESAAWIIKSRNKQLETTPPLQVLQQPEDLPRTGGRSWSDTGEIEVFPEGFGTVGTSVHELSHSSDRPIDGINRLIPQKDIDYIKEHKAKMLGDSREYFDYLDYYKSLSNQELAEENKNFQEFYTDYVGNPTETRARLNTVRYLAKKNNLYDPFTQKVTPEIFKNKLKNFEYEKGDKSGFDPMMQLKSLFGDEEIIYMLNNISQNENPETNDELQYSKKGGSIQLELSDEEIQDYIKRGYVIEEATPKMNNGGPIVKDLWKQVTGTPWEEAKARGLTTGTFDENIALRNRLLAGEFGKVDLKPTKSEYDLAVERLVKSGRTLDELVEMRVGTESGLKNRFPELFDEETKDKVEAQLDQEKDENYGLQAKINLNPYSDFGKTKNKIKSLGSNKISIDSIEPYELSSFDLDSPWKNKMYSDFGKPKINNTIGKKDKWGRSKDDKWYGFDPQTKQWTLGIPKWKSNQTKLSDKDKDDLKKIEPKIDSDKKIQKINKSEKDFISNLKSQLEEINKLKTLNEELDNQKKKLTGSTLPQGSMGNKNFDNIYYDPNTKTNNKYYNEPGLIDEVKQKYDDAKEWAENQYELAERGIKRKLTTFGIVDDSDQEIKELEPVSADKYYSNPYGAQQVFNVDNGNGRQFKQQTLPVSTIKFGYRNRGDLNEINTDGIEITTFEGFTKNPKNINNSNSVLALDPQGRLHTGNWGILKNKMNDDWVFTKTFMNKVVSIDDNFLDGARSGNRGYWQPQITTLDDSGKKKVGALNILTKGKDKEKFYGSIQGGRVLIVDPKTKEQYLISGSLDHIKKEFKRIKGDNSYLEVYTLDNGTYSRGLSYNDKKLTKERLRSYDNENTSGGNGLYIINYDMPINKYQQDVIKGMPNVRTRTDTSYKKGHKLKNDAQMIVLHHTGNIDPSIGKKAIRDQYMKKGNNSSHVVIYQDGSREIYASPEQVTFHAGFSRWGSKEDLNDFSIGVEFDGDTNYEPLTDAQIESFVEYYDPLAKKYNIKLSDIITHQMIRNRYLKAHKNETGKVKDKPDITQTEYRKILQYLKDKGYE